MGSAIVRTLSLALALSCATLAHAQLPAPPATTEDALRQMFDQAAIVFTGQVTTIRSVNSANDVLEVDFSIDDAILGVTTGTYTLREWAGLAPNRDTPFLVGHHYLMFLHAPGLSGLSSPVGGPDGAIPILASAEPASPTTPDSAGLAAQAALTQSLSTAAAPHTPARSALRLGSANESAIALPAISANSLALASSQVDLRWIAARVLAPLSYAPSEPAAAHPITSTARISAAPDTEPSSAASLAPAPAQSSNYADLLTLLRSWETPPHAAR